jgi:hypothetical protein
MSSESSSSSGYISARQEYAKQLSGTQNNQQDEINNPSNLHGVPKMGVLGENNKVTILGNDDSN